MLRCNWLNIFKTLVNLVTGILESHAMKTLHSKCWIDKDTKLRREEESTSTATFIYLKGALVR